MIWIAPSEKDTDTAALGKRLWDAADQFRADSGFKSQEYSAPLLGLIFLRFAEVRFAAQRAKLEKASASARRGSRGMFVSSARFFSEHKKNPAAELSIHGVEKTDETGRLCRLNLAVHGLEGEIKHGGGENCEPRSVNDEWSFHE